MFTLPSMSNLVISTIVFFVAAWYLHRYLEDQGIPKGMTRKFLVFAVASLISWGAGEAVDWFQGKPDVPQPQAQTPGDLSQLLKAIGQGKP